MMKRFFSILTAALITLFSISCPAYAHDNIFGGNVSVLASANTVLTDTETDLSGEYVYSSNQKAFIIDEGYRFSEEERRQLIESAEAFTESTGLNIAIAVTNDVGFDRTETGVANYADSLYEQYCGKDTDGLLLLINNDTYYDYISTSGAAIDYYGSQRIADILDLIRDDLSDGHFSVAAAFFISAAEMYYNDGPEISSSEDTPASEAPVNSLTESGVDLTGAIVLSSNQKAYLVDESHYFNAKEREKLITQAEEYTIKTGLNIVVAIVDDVGADKSDRGVEDYADVMYENLCGINTDGILFLVNNDTKYDRISTSGSGINYYSDYRIERMLDNIYEYLPDGDYYRAASAFISSAGSYYDLGKANNQIEVAGAEFELKDFLYMAAIAIIIAAIIGFFIKAGISGAYKLQRPINEIYMVKGSKLFQQATDTYVDTIVTRIYSPRSSGGSSGGGHSGHSSTHHSSGGGRHGGGGRHR